MTGNLTENLTENLNPTTNDYSPLQTQTTQKKCAVHKFFRKFRSMNHCSSVQYLSTARQVPVFRRMAAWTLSVVCVMALCAVMPRLVQAQYYHVGLNQGIALPQRALTGIVSSPAWLPSLAVYYFPKNNPMVIGGSISFQPFERNETAKQGEGYDVLSIPVSFCFQYLLLPEDFRPYYGVETGIAWVRYRFFNSDIFQGTQQAVSLVVAPNVGVKITLFEEMDVDFNVRYQFLFHDPIEWGSRNQMIQGYQILGISLGLNYRLFRGL
jgi:hypothetical protein